MSSRAAWCAIAAAVVACTSIGCTSDGDDGPTDPDIFANAPTYKTMVARLLEADFAVFLIDPDDDDTEILWKQLDGQRRLDLITRSDDLLYGDSMVFALGGFDVASCLWSVDASKDTALALCEPAADSFASRQHLGPFDQWNEGQLRRVDEILGETAYCYEVAGIGGQGEACFSDEGLPLRASNRDSFGDGRTKRIQVVSIDADPVPADFRLPLPEADWEALKGVDIEPDFLVLPDSTLVTEFRAAEPD